MSEDAETLKLRQQLLKLCPQEEKQIMIMDKNDLKDLLAIVQNGINSNPLQKRKNMQKKILEVCPGMDRQLKDLGDQDIQDIYTKCLEKQKQTLAKKKGIANEVSIGEMKKVLMDKLPAYRNDIKNMADNEIKKMYKQLQQDEIKGSNEKSQNQQTNRSSNPSKDGHRKSKNGTAYDHSKSGNSRQQLNGKDQIFTIKQSAKMRKLKHKCKISFYFNQSDFETEVSKNNNTAEQSSKRRKNIIAKIVDSLSDVLGKKAWNKKESKNSGKLGLEQVKGKQIEENSKTYENQIEGSEKLNSLQAQNSGPRQKSQGLN